MRDPGVPDPNEVIDEARDPGRVVLTNRWKGESIERVDAHGRQVEILQDRYAGIVGLDLEEKDTIDAAVRREPPVRLNGVCRLGQHLQDEGIVASTEDRLDAAEERAEERVRFEDGRVSLDDETEGEGALGGEALAPDGRDEAELVGNVTNALPGRVRDPWPAVQRHGGRADRDSRP
jgi:hypothetical protein